MPTHTRVAEGRKTNKFVQFTPRLWHAWMRARQPDEHSEKLANDIAEFRTHLESLENVNRFITSETPKR